MACVRTRMRHACISMGSVACWAVERGARVQCCHQLQLRMASGLCIPFYIASILLLVWCGVGCRGACVCCCWGAAHMWDMGYVLGTWAECCSGCSAPSTGRSRRLYR